MYLYFFILFTTYFLGACSYKKKCAILASGEKQWFNVVNQGFFLILFLFLGFFSMLRDVGTDLPMYRNIFNNADLGAEYFSGQEPGYLLLNVFFYKIGFNDFCFIALLSLATLFFVFKTIRAHSDTIDVGLAFFAFVSLYYLQSFSLIRMYLVAAILLYCSKYLFEKRYFKYLICVIGCVFLHYSAILMTLPLSLHYIYQEHRHLFWPTLLSLLIFSFVVVTKLSNVPIFSRYDEYLSGGALKTGFGFMQIAVNIPNLFFCWYARRIKIRAVYVDVLFSFSMSALLIGILSYKVLMLGRSLVYYNIIYIICVPYILYKIGRKNKQFGALMGLFYFIYLILRFIQYMNEYILLDGLMPYKFISTYE